jgi:hypothetical protein
VLTIDPDPNMRGSSPHAAQIQHHRPVRGIHRHTRIAPPPDLEGPARSQFLDISLACRPDHFDRVDVPLLARYARALIAEQKAADELERASVIDDRPSPWLAVWVARMHVVTVLSRLLKVNPAARQSSPASEDAAPPISAYERMALEAQRDGRN